MDGLKYIKDRSLNLHRALFQPGAKVILESRPINKFPRFLALSEFFYLMGVYTSIDPQFRKVSYYHF